MKTYDKTDPKTIQKMFDNIAKQYDRTNGVLSFQMHKQWNKTLARLVLQRKEPETYLDLCCGTGEIARNLLKRAPRHCEAFLLDFSGEMLRCAKDKLKLDRHHLHFIQADAQEIPLPSESIDCATIAYGIRNIKSPEACFAETYRVLRQGGCFGILELTKPENPFLRLGHSLYLRAVLPALGKFMTTDKEAYKYLCQSIHRFTPPAELELMLKEVGFTGIERQPLMGGIATIITALKRPKN